MTDQATWERAEADRIAAMMREVEKFDSPGLVGNDVARRKKRGVLERHRRVSSTYPHHPDTYRAVGFPVVTGRPKFSSNNPDDMLAPIILPAWDEHQEFVAASPSSIDSILRSPAFLEHGSLFNPKNGTRLDRERCYWHRGSISGNGPCRLLTQTSGQFVCVWWVCPRCQRSLGDDGICWVAPGARR